MTVPAGDGIFFYGKTLYVVRNTANEIAAIRLAARPPPGGTVVDRFGDPGFDVPTTIDRFGQPPLRGVECGGSGTAMDATTEYWVTQVPRG